MADFVLVHGMTQAPAGWGLLAAELRERHHRVVAVDLAVPQPFFSAADYARATADALAGRVDEPVVVAHSAAGLVLPNIGAALHARHLVWVAATVPDVDGGRSLYDEVLVDSEAVFHPEWLGVDPTGDPLLATYFLFHQAPREGTVAFR